MVLGSVLAEAAEPITIHMMAASLGIPPPQATDTRSLARRAVFNEFQRRNPGIRVANAGGLELYSDSSEVGLPMSMAGGTGPDIFYVNFRQYYNYIDQGFCRPLDDVLAQNPEIRDGINPTIRKVLESYDGHIYSVPFFTVAQGLYYRRDHFLEAGLDPSRPPQTWEEFREYAKKLTNTNLGRSGFGFNTVPQSRAYYWINFLWQAGGEVVVPAENGRWRANIATPAGAKALDFYKHLTVDTWLNPEGLKEGPAALLSPDLGADINRGKVSMWFSYTNDVVLNVSEIPPTVIGIASMPAGPGGKFNEINAGMWAISAKVKDPARLAACWKFIEYFASQEAARVSTERFIEFGLGNLVNPTLLKKFGHADIAATVDKGWVKANEELFKTGKPEPYGKNCQQVYSVLDHALERAQVESTPSIEILKGVQEEMDRKLLGYTPPEVMQVQRAWALGFLLVGGLLVSALVFVGFRKASLQVAVTQSKHVSIKNLLFMAACLAPAVLSIMIWAYYPLGRGLELAFVDYKVMGGSKWIGLDNFIAVFTQPIFYKSLLNSFIYVGLTIVIGFFIPIMLALSLNEIPRAKVFFRTVYYLPAMTSPIVIALLWRQIYDKKPDGVLNSLLTGPFWVWCQVAHLPYQPLALDWLGSERLAMLAVVLPGIWAGAGPGSILYLAALKNIPDERYEAADLDGAGWLQKIRAITLPGLRPLMLINLLGVFIGGFKAMENVFVMTGGGPLYATHLIGIEIWTNAFQFLKFGYATAAAWVLGAILVGFTMVQIRSLTQMKFGISRN